MNIIHKVLLISFFAIVSSCGGRGNSLILYKDSEQVRDKNIEIGISEIVESVNTTNDFYLKAGITFLDNDSKSITLNFKSWMVIREEDKKEFVVNWSPVGTKGPQDVILTPKRKSIIEFSSELPSSIKNENYQLVVKYNDKALICHLYDKDAK